MATPKAGGGQLKNVSPSQPSPYAGSSPQAPTPGASTPPVGIAPPPAVQATPGGAAPGMMPWQKTPAPGTTPGSPGADGLYHPTPRFDATTGKPIPQWGNFFGGGFGGAAPRGLPPPRKIPTPGPGGPGGIVPGMSGYGGMDPSMLARILGGFGG